MNTGGGQRINNNYYSSNPQSSGTTSGAAGNTRPILAPRPQPQQQQQQQQRQQALTSYPQILQQYQSAHTQQVQQQQQQKRKKAASQHGIPPLKTMNFSETPTQTYNINNTNVGNIDKNNNMNMHMRSSYDSQQQQVHVSLQQVRLSQQEPDGTGNSQYQQQQQSFWTSPSPAHSRLAGSIGNNSSNMMMTAFSNGNQKSNGIFQQQPQSALDQSRSLIHDNSLVVHTMPDSPSPIKPIKSQLSHLNCSSSLGKDVIPQMKQLEAKISLAQQQNNSGKENISNSINTISNGCRQNLSASQKWRSRTSSSACGNSQDLKRAAVRVSAADKDPQLDAFNSQENNNNNNLSIKRIQSLQEQTNSLLGKNESLSDRLQALYSHFKALKEVLMVCFVFVILATQETLKNQVAALTAGSQHDKQQLSEKDTIIQGLQAQLAQLQLQQQQQKQESQQQPQPQQQQQQSLPFQSSDSLKYNQSSSPSFFFILFHFN